MNNILRIALLAKPYRKLLLLVSGLILLTSIIQLTTPLVTKNIVDEIQLQISTHAGNATKLKYLLLLAFGLNLTAISFSAVSDRLGDAVSARITKYLINTFYDRILRLPQSYFDSELSGKILNQLTRGINAIGEFIGAATNFILPSILQTILSISILCYYNLTIGLLALAVFPFYILISHYSTKRWAVFEVKKNVIEDQYKNRIVEVIQNMKLVKTTNTQLQESSFIRSLIRKYVSIYDRQSVGYHWLNFSRNFVLEIILIIIILITFQNTFNGVFSLGVMVLIIQLLGQLRRPLFAMSFMLERIKKAEAGAKEFFSIINLPSSEGMPPSKNKPLYSHPTVTLQNISFNYDQKPILTNINLDIKPGENIALIGASGAGKTTLVNLLLRLYEPGKGTILLNSKPYPSFSHAKIRAHFAYVFQDNELFSSTVKDNVMYGNPDASPKDLNRALKGAYVTDFIMELTQGINTQIGEKGVKLSGGQKQRLQIARALLSPAPILILDEATSSLDAKSESLVQQAFINLTRTKTVIIIAHRFSTLQHVDRIVVIDRGKIVDQGSPGDLADRPGIFKELLRYQIEGNQKLLAKYDITA